MMKISVEIMRPGIAIRSFNPAKSKVCPDVLSKANLIINNIVVAVINIPVTRFLNPRDTL